MSFFVSLQKWVASGIVAGLLLCVAGCGPESTTPSSSKPREQAGSTTGGAAKKGRAEVPEPAPADEGDKKSDAEKAAEDKPADEKKE